ncbi:MAG: hypothetical protein QXH67_02085 [Candidatus Bathyarchaeia archaeon]
MSGCSSGDLSKSLQHTSDKPVSPENRDPPSPPTVNGCINTPEASNHSVAGRTGLQDITREDDVAVERSKAGGAWEISHPGIKMPRASMAY